MGNPFGNMVAGARRGTRHLIAAVAVFGVFLAFQPTAQAATFTSSNPVGSFDVMTIVPGGYGVAGWALDPNTTDPIKLHVYVNGTFLEEFMADSFRPDVGASYPGHGDNHGFEAAYESKPGSLDVCVYGINVGPVGRGNNSLLGCRVVTVPGDPFGSFGVGAMAPGGTRIAGWAIDAQTEDPIGVHVYVDNVFTGAFEASATRADIASVHPGYGDAHGFNVVLPTGGAKPSSVQIYGINQGSGTSSLLHWGVVD